MSTIVDKAINILGEILQERRMIQILTPETRCLKQWIHLPLCRLDSEATSSVSSNLRTDIGFTLYNAGAQSGVVVVAGVAAVAVAVAVGVSARVRLSVT